MVNAEFWSDLDLVKPKNAREEAIIHFLKAAKRNLVSKEDAKRNLPKKRRGNERACSIAERCLVRGY
jgi:hypothetical protein